MNITPLTTYGVQTASGQAIAPQTSRISTGQATFLDVFSRVMSDAIETNRIKDQDMVKLMLGETDHLEQMALNMVKAEIATDLLINVRNNVLDAYNDIIRMQI
ncbi:MAG: flagellar hook-basal body complex protein FliE [Oscillospiraceae bacterium]|nr:flagellar hook-basal body complex protein FliE [Oscillospiraceae bacterium]